MTRCPTGAWAPPGFCCRRSRSGSGTTSATTGRSTCNDEVLRYAFDRGITHFDLANNYGPPYGSAEENFGRMLRRDFKPYRNELIISTKAGWDMWPGPYGQLGGRAYLLASLDESLDRLGLDYVDIFYSHRIDPTTPLDETIGALDTAVRAGKARYVGISSYSAAKTAEAAAIAQRLGTPLVIHQPSYSLLNRWIEGGLTTELANAGMGAIAFTALAQGLLTDRYLQRPAADIDRATTRPTFDDELVTERGPRTASRTRRYRRAPWPVAGAACAGLGASRPHGGLDARRRVERRPARRESRRARRIWTSRRMNSAKSTSTRQIPVSICGERAPMCSRPSAIGSFDHAHDRPRIAGLREPTPSRYSR